jgi:hypothetical protein
MQKNINAPCVRAPFTILCVNISLSLFSGLTRILQNRGKNYEAADHYINVGEVCKMATQ